MARWGLGSRVERLGFLHVIAATTSAARRWPGDISAWTPKVCEIIACMAAIMGSGLEFMTVIVGLGL